MIARVSYTTRTIAPFSCQDRELHVLGAEAQMMVDFNTRVGTARLTIRSGQPTSQSSFRVRSHAL